MTWKTYPNKLSVDIRDLDILDDNVVAIGDLQTFTFAGSKNKTYIENCQTSYWHSGVVTFAEEGLVVANFERVGSSDLICCLKYLRKDISIKIDGLPVVLAAFGS